LQLGAQLLLALIHAHEKGVVHRDIKPDNVFLLSQSGVRLHVRVLDFGIARIYRKEETAPGADAARLASITLTQPGAVLGTPRYMAPEQLAGQPADGRSDLYSAAVVLFEAMTGQLPYTSGRRLRELCPQAAAELEALIEQCLRPDPDDRPASAAEVYLRLHELGKASGALLVSPETIKQLTARFHAAAASEASTKTYLPGGRWRSRRSLLLLTAGAAGLMALAGYGLTVWLGPPPVPAVESLLGLKAGDTRDDAIAKLGKPARARRGDPWTAAPALFGELLRPADLGENIDRAGLELLTWDDDHAAVLLHDNEVRAVLVRAPRAAETGRRVRDGDSERRLRQRYEDPDDIVMARHPADEGGRHRAWGVIYRYARVGLSFEVRDEHVAAIALYPKK
jgi:hypothetical protein